MVVSKIAKLPSVRAVIPPALVAQLPDTGGIFTSATSALGNIAGAVVDHSLLVGGTVLAATVVGLTAAVATCYILQDAKEAPAAIPAATTAVPVADAPEAKLTAPQPKPPRMTTSTGREETQNTAELRRELQHARAESQKTMENLQRLRLKLSKLETENQQLNSLIDEKQSRLAALGKERRGVDEKLAVASRPPPTDGQAVGQYKGKDLQEILRFNVAVIEAAAEKSEFLLRKITSEQEAVSAILQQSLSRLDVTMGEVHEQTSHAKLDLFSAGQQNQKALQALAQASAGKVHLPTVVTEIAKQSRVSDLRSQFNLPQTTSSSTRPFAQMKAHSGTNTIEFVPKYEPMLNNADGVQRRSGNIDQLINNTPAKAPEAASNKLSLLRATTKTANEVFEGSSIEMSTKTRESGFDSVSSENSVKTEGGSPIRLKRSSSRKALEALGSCFGAPKKPSQSKLQKTPRRSNESLDMDRLHSHIIHDDLNEY